MSQSDKVIRSALRLPRGERARIALALVESLDDRDEPESEDAWAAEIADRVEALRRGELETLSASDSIASALTRIRLKRA